MDAKHTPGPWQAGRPDMATLVDGVESKWIFAGDQYVAIASGQIAGDWAEVMANARLIAAAPELLAALNGLVGLVQLVRGRPDCPVEIKQALTDNYRLDDAFAAIAKAEGT